MSKSWGTELWDQYATLEKFTERGIDFLDRYSAFVKERQKIEMEYASQLKKLIKSYSPKKKEEEDYTQYSSLRTFRGVLQEVGSIANQHELIAENLGKDVFNEVVKLIGELKKERKDYLLEAKQEDAAMEKSKRKLEACKSQYRHAHEAWMQAKILFEKADSDDNRTKAEVERARQTMDQKNHTREQQKNEYILQLQNTNKEQQEHYSNKLPAIFNKLQAMEEKRVTYLGKYYENYAESHKQVLPVITQCLDDIKTKYGQAVEPPKDSQVTINRYETGIQPPGDIAMMDLDEPGGGTIKPANNEKDNISIKSENGANSLPGRGKPGKQKRGLFGTVFSKKEEPKDFSNLPPNQQKQKLQGKIDEIQSRIDQEVKQKEALLKMRDVYTANSSLGDPNSVNKQLETIGRRIDSLRLELNTYQEYKNKAEGKISTPQNQTKGSPTRSSTGTIDAHTPSIGGSSPRNGSPVKDHEEPPSSPLSPLEHGDSFLEDDDEFDDDADVSDHPVGTCSALYEFESEDPNLLNMREGEQLDIIEEDSGDGWTRVRRSDKTEGYVPTSYISIG